MAPENLKENDIDEALDESFPASDPPSWTPGEIKTHNDETNKPHPNEKITKPTDRLRKVSAALGQWQKQIVSKIRTSDDKSEIPHPAAAPISTDQEAGGNSTTPDGTRLNDH